MADGSWALAAELYARGDLGFVAELRFLHDAERLGDLAARWLADARPEARRLLIAYLSGPMNAYRHEALVKRLFKAAERAGDDELMGLFLAAFDRSIRSRRKTITHSKYEVFSTQLAADQLLREWEREGYTPTSTYSGGRRFVAYAVKREEVVRTIADKMPRPRPEQQSRVERVTMEDRSYFERRHRLFSVPTRRYLRRRAWRYFRKIGATDPHRYRTAAVAYLKLYNDADVDSDIHLLDNWGLVHTLFGESPTLVHPAKGWAFAAGKTLADLTAAPRFPEAWRDASHALFELLTQASCRTVRQWAATLLRADHAEWLRRQPVAELIALIEHSDPVVAGLGFELLEGYADLADVPIKTWLRLLDGDDLERLQRLSGLLMNRLDPVRVTLGDAVELAVNRSFPVARLGFSLLRRRGATAADEPLLLRLTQVECEAIRYDAASWLRQTLMRFGPATSEQLLEFLDSKHADVRSVGWIWLHETPLKDEPTLWQKVMESPYEDVRRLLAAELAARVTGADQDVVRLLWATLLLNLHGGGRNKPGVVRQITARLRAEPTESERLLPLLAVAVRSLRGPEFRAGLSGVVTLFETQEALRPALARQFPELVVS